MKVLGMILRVIGGLTGALLVVAGGIVMWSATGSGGFAGVLSTIFGLMLLVVSLQPYEE